MPENYNCDSVIIFLTHIITPNGDGINDIFHINPARITYVKLEVYHGLRKIFEGKGEHVGWDGSKNGKVKEGSFGYKATLTTIHSESIEITDQACVVKSSISTCRTEGCIFPDMLHPHYGVISNTSEPLADDC